MYASVATSLLMAVAVMAQEGPRIETPASVVQCQPSRLQWAGGSPPYWVTVIPAGQPGGQTIMTLADSSQATSMTWNVNLEPNTQVSLQIRDGTGAVQYSSPITVQAGSNTDCMNASPSATDSQGAVAGAAGGPTNQAGGDASAAPSAAGSASPSAAGTGAAASPSAASGSPSSAAASPSSAAAGTSSAAQPSSSAAQQSSASGGLASSVASVATSATSAAGAAATTPAAGGASAINAPIFGAAAVAAAIMAYV